MALHDLLHQSNPPEKPEPTVTQNPAQSNTGNETDLRAQINDQQRQIEELIGVRKDLREKVEELSETAAKFRRESERYEALAMAAERRVKEADDENQKLQDAIDDAEDSVVVVSLKAQVENLERQVREAQASARARDEDYRRERREKEAAQEALRVFEETAEEYAEPPEFKVRRFQVEICPEVPTTPEVPRIEIFEADEVQVAQDVGHIFFFKAGTLIGGVAHNEWKSLREIESDGDDEPDV